MTDAIPGTIGRYRILSELGRGAMGVVYRAEDPQLERTVAIKAIRMSADAGDLTEYLARFRQEAKALGGLNHPGIVTVFDIGREGDLAYLAMELLEGVELREMLAQSRLPVRQIVELAAQVADGLAYAHERGIVHRDIKPANIMVMEGARAKIMDFGIARVRVSDVTTQAGMLLGSPQYMSPEQVVGQPVDRRSDLFSLGVVLYEMLAGAPPFSGADLNQLMFQIVNAQPSPPSRLNPDSPEILDLIVARALEKSAANRYQSAGEMAADLRSSRGALPEGPPAGAPREFGGDTWSPETGATLAGTTAPAGASLAGTTAQAGASLGLFVSRPFDSTRALARLTRPSDRDRVLLSPSPSEAGAWGRLLRDGDRLFVTAALGIAAAIALYVALG